MGPSMSPCLIMTQAINVMYYFIESDSLFGNMCNALRTCSGMNFAIYSSFNECEENQWIHFTLEIFFNDSLLCPGQANTHSGALSLLHKSKLNIGITPDQTTVYAEFYYGLRL